MKTHETTSIKMFIVMLLSFSSIMLLHRVGVFIGETPKINPVFITKLKNIPYYSLNLSSSISNRSNPNSANSVSVFSQLPSTQAPPGTIFSPLTKGVYAADDKTTNKKYIKIVAGTKMSMETITLSDGKKITVLTPLE